VHRYPTVSKRTNREQLTSLAVAIAAGQSVSDWAKASEVPRRTAYRWSRLPETRRIVADARRRSIDRAIGTLSKNATAAAQEIARLAAKADAEAVRLAACRGLLSDLMTVTNHQALADRVADIERRLHERREPGPTA